MRYHFFLHYGWFLQNLEKDFIPTLLHTTVVCIQIENFFFNLLQLKDGGFFFVIYITSTNILKKYLVKVHKNVEVPFYFKLWWMQNLKKVQGCVINIYSLPLVLCSYGKYGMIPYCTALALHLRVTVFTYILTQLSHKDC